MDAIILAGGKGTRLSSVVNNVPKPLALVNGRPFLDILLSQLNSFSFIKKVILAVGYKSDMIIDRYKDCPNYNFRIIFSIEDKLLGTGGAIKKALALTDTDDVLILNGDSYIEVNIEDMVRFHKVNKALSTIVLKDVDNVGRYGSIEIDDKKRIISFNEKSSIKRSGLINAGVYILRKSLFGDIEGGREISFEKEILPQFVRNDVYGYVVEGKFIDIGVPESYRIAGEYLKRGMM